MGGSGSRRDRRSRTRTAVVAGLSVLAAIGAVACTAGGLPAGRPPTTTVPDAPATTLYGTPPLPDQLVAVGDDGVLAVVHSGTGDRLVELAHGAAPGSHKRSIRGVSVSPEGDTAWFDTRGRRPGSGRIYQVPTDGSAEPVQVASGTYPAVSPSGSQLAFVGEGAVVVHGIVTDEALSWPQTGRITDLAWTTDGTGLLWVRNRTELVWLDIAGDAEPQVVATVAARESLSLPRGTLHDSGSVSVLVSRGRYDPASDRLAIRLGIEPTRSPERFGRLLDRSADQSGWWGLYVTGDHTIRWTGSGGIGTIASGYIAARYIGHTTATI